MPISITRRQGKGEYQDVAWLCDDDWKLPSQIQALDAWLQAAGPALSPGSYRADIGFDLRPDALGGGAILPVPMLTTLSALNMALHLSEYPGLNRKDPNP
jgi:hypothetical protein